MTNIYMDKNYIKIVKDILNNNNFTKIKEHRHHGNNRLDHSLKVSYYGYKVTKFLGLDYIETARAGLLHDFYIIEEGASLKEVLLTYLIHSHKSLANAKKYFALSNKEQDIITSHMFPIGLIPPKYMEGWVITILDKIIATHEWYLFFKVKVKLATNLVALLIFHFFKSF